VPDENDIQVNWFSDGGICSNFPIHFFDAWLPTRPTFGINLIPMPQEAFTEEKNEIKPQYQSLLDVDVISKADHDAVFDAVISKTVHVPRADQPIAPEWREVKGLKAFAQAIFSAAQNYRDTTQAMLPSYRERIVQVRFDPHEGGLNLAMTPETIKAIQQKGEKAAEKLSQYFRFPHHQWVRFQVLVALMEKQLKQMEDALRKINYEQLMQEQIALQTHEDLNERFPYPRPEDWCNEAIKRVEALRDLVQQWDRQKYLIEDSPRPEPVLRVTPEL